MKNWSFQLFFLSVFCLATTLCNARDTKMPLTNFDATITSCNPPAGLLVTQVGPSWIDLMWPSVSGVAQYHLVTYEASSGSVVSDMLVNQVPGVTMSARVNGLTPGNSYYAKIWSICPSENGNSQSESYAVTPPVLIPILDLVQTGFQTCQDMASWPEGNEVLFDLPPGAPANCTFAWNPTPTYFRIKKVGSSNVAMEFSVEVQGTMAIIRNNTFDSDCCNGLNKYFFGEETSEFVTIAYNTANSLKARITIKHSPPTSPNGLLYRTLDTDNKIDEFKIYKLIPPPETNCSADRSDVPVTTTTDALSASPNPFTNTLEVKIPYATPENDVKVSLYDLQGRLMLSEKTTGGTQIHSLSTADLLPGLYLLRVDTGDRSETIKVVKTQ
jgi:hypothetical protein